MNIKEESRVKAYLSIKTHRDKEISLTDVIIRSFAVVSLTVMM